MAKGEIEPGMKPKQFPKGVSGNPKGRPKDRVLEQLQSIFGTRQAKRIERRRLTKAERDHWRALVGSLSQDQAKTIAAFADADLFIKNLIVAYISDMRNGKTTTLDRIEETLDGRRSTVAITGPDGADLIPARTLTAAEMKDLMKELEDEY